MTIKSVYLAALLTLPLNYHILDRALKRELTTEFENISSFKMEAPSLSYREVIPDLSVLDDWTEIVLNTGTCKSTLQDIKVAEKAGGYCYQNVEQHYTRNRFIYWRSYKDVLELSEISLDFNLYQNNLRYKFTDSPVIAVSLTEQEQYVTLLVATVCSLHRMKYPHPNILAEGSQIGSASSSEGSISCFGSTQSFSIFRDANSSAISKQNIVYAVDNSNTSHNLMPHTAACYLAPNGEEAFFALAYQAQLMIYIMNFETGQTVSHQLKEHAIMPRLFSNLKGALIGKSDTSDADFATSISFLNINDIIYLASLYRNDVLRVWSTSSFQSACSLNCVREQRGGEHRTQGPQSNSLRKINDNNVCVFLSHSTGAEFICIEIHVDAGNSSSLSLVHRRIIAAPHLDLTDFEVSEKRIWALWSNAEGEFSVSSFPLSSGASIMQQWVSAAMEPPPDRFCVGNGQGMDPREAYCSYIFHPGKFDRSVISKALLMFRRTNIRFEAKNCSMALLKEHVCQCIEEELLNELKDTDFNDEEYVDAAARLWERFYTGCEQYHMKACQPTGLIILQPVDGVCIVKKNKFSLLRPCETLEHMMLAGDNIDISYLVPMQFSENESIGEDMAYLIGIISQIEKWLSEDTKLELDKKLYQLETPDALISKLSTEILSGAGDSEMFPSNFLIEIRQKLQAIGDIKLAISVLLENLRMDNGVPEIMQTNLAGTHSSQFLFNIGVLFGSTIGLSILSETVRQSAMIRFAVCRNLLLLQKLLIETYSLPVHILDKMRSQFIPDTITFLQSYYVMVWISETPVNFAIIAASETSVQRLNMLQLTSGSGRVYSMMGKVHAASLLRIFLNAKGLYTALSLYADSYDPSPGWNNTLLLLNTIVSQLIWPVSYNFTFGEWLLGTCQHTLIEDYVRLLNSWCEWNVCSRQFILAVSLLDCGEAQKAYDNFLQSAKGVFIEQFLTQKILKNTNLPERMEQLNSADASCPEAICLSNQATAQFYLKVIQLLEQHNALDHIISLAQVAIGLLKQNDPQLPMFQSIVFNNHLQLQHYEEAYHALIYNAESSRRKDCLRQLVVTLFSQRRLDLLMHFPYIGLHDEFENIIETRARSLSIEKNDIYDFLYAFHVNIGNMRKASVAMYEQAMRLQLETNSIDAMEKRCDCLLACINALHLIDPRYRWIAKPVIGEDYSCTTINMNDRNDDESGNSNAKDIQRTTEQQYPQVVVLEIKDIHRELLHTDALVRLSTKRSDVDSYFNAGPQELSLILASCGMFTDALKLAKGFDITLLPIFDCLTSACVRTADENPNEAWSWLQENDLADLPHRNRAPDMAWALLERLVKENEKKGCTLIRKNVVNKLLSLNVFIPQWLMCSYKLDNCSELLYLFVKHSRLIEATELAQEMINAMLGSGSEYFSFKHAITITNPEMCLPLGTLDLLLHALKLNADDIEYKQAFVELDELLHTYVKTAMRTANDKRQMAIEMEVDREQQRA